MRRMLPKHPMRRRVTAALCGWLACAPLAAQVPTAAPVAAALAPATLAQAVVDAVALAQQAAAVLAPPGARVQVQPGLLDARLKLAPCARIEPYLPAGVPAWGRTRVGLRCAEGRSLWHVSLPLTVQVWAPAWVATGALPAGTRLTPQQLVLAEQDWAAGAQPPQADVQALAGRILARAVAAGQALRDADLLARQWFAIGETVRVVTVGGGFSVTAEGRALGAGMEGRPVRVLIGESRVVVGRAVAEHRVEVGL